MSKTFKTSVNNTFDFEINNSDISNLDALQISESKFHILEQNKSYKAEITRADFNKKSYKVKVNGNTYEINISNNLDILIKEMGFAIGSSKHIDSVKAPMPGLILEINVKTNQEVKEDDPLFILEAMKMENIITSPCNGIIKSISVNKGDAVEKNQLIIEFDA
ncbi:acetyl-CoA carboxylase biotin carboxyl carrier protein subunit [Flavivirga spongiicola]|uniref:Acetyl-CoA carboxylase biotin carboxyl carrier protein subunit n=1 Tax=Flavivirga spongiicola TaxID=421621 RepID=A0ABU7XP27_9FLAO|nr:acetyl-CoA carboxylase biotin carboxyl carrier protein subunit [Flavivirga sp. MEBiC05379]MDO5981291.1 acetyl-CoA carboxylase biotin carboxyl carrier protein subunit [Flavivirga sp. MEBiC05379]